MEIFLTTLLIVGILVLAIGLITIEDGGGGIIALGGVLFILGLWGCIIASLTSEESIYEIETNKPIVPELRITVKDSVTIDTVYIYKIKQS